MISVPQYHPAHGQQKEHHRIQRPAPAMSRLGRGCGQIRSGQSGLRIGGAAAAAGAARRARKLASTSSALVIRMTAKASPGTNASPLPRSRATAMARTTVISPRGMTQKINSRLCASIPRQAQRLE